MMFKKFYSRVNARLFLFITFFLIIVGCNTTTKNVKAPTFGDLKRHFESCGIECKLDSILDPGPAMASKAIALRIGDRNVGIYFYDETKTKVKEKLDLIREKKELYLLGIRYSAVINGGFVLIDAELHENGKAITNAFESFVSK